MSELLSIALIKNDAIYRSINRFFSFLLRSIRDPQSSLSFLSPIQVIQIWLQLTFREFKVEGSQEEIRNYRLKRALLFHALFDQWPKQEFDQENLKQWMQLALNFCIEIDGENVRHSRSKLYSYHDVFNQVESLKIIIFIFSGLSGSQPNSKIRLAEILSSTFPSSRIVLIVRGHIDLAGGNLDNAIDAARKALSIETGCSRAQKLLYDAYIQKKKKDPLFIQNDLCLDDLTERFCPRPFDTLTTVDSAGKCMTFLCNCGGWLPYSAGNILDAKEVDSVWNSKTAQEIRRSIINGDFSYCSRNLCPSILRDELPKKREITDPTLRTYIDQKVTYVSEAPKNVQLSHDASCNLACPSCRIEIMTANAAQNDRLSEARDRFILPLLTKVKGITVITGWGDPFASRHYRSILERLNRKDYPYLSLLIVTNGLLLNPKQWEAIHAAHEMILNLSVSVDAASAETYEDVRRPGRWSQLLTNLEFLGEQRRVGNLKSLILNFVVQKKNFREMPNFVRLGIDLGVDLVRFQKYWNFGAQTMDAFTDANVSASSHPLNAEFRDILKDPLLGNPIVDSYNLNSLFADAQVSRT